MSDCTGPAYVVNIAEWMTAYRLNAPLDGMMCSTTGCDGWLRPVGSPPAQHQRDYFLEAVCEKCHVSYGWPNGKTLAWFEERAHRKAGKTPRRSTAQAGASVPPLPDPPAVDQPELVGPI